MSTQHEVTDKLKAQAEKAAQGGKEAGKAARAKLGEVQAKLKSDLRKDTHD